MAQQEAEMALREFHWKAIERKRLPYDMAMTRKAAAIFTEMADEVSAAFKKGGKKAAAEKIESYQANWIALYELTYKNIFDDIGNAELENILGQATQKATRLDQITDKGVMKWIALTCAKKVTNVLDFTKQSIAAVIFDLEELYQRENYSAHIDKIAKGIKEKFQDFSRYRSYMIARTEVAGASNAATHKAQQVAQQKLDPTGNKMQVKRQWLSSRDQRVRDSHEHMDGQIVGLEEPFTIYTDTGEPTERKLQYPADYEADEPGETINCRCVSKTLLVKA